MSSTSLCVLSTKVIQVKTCQCAMASLIVLSLNVSFLMLSGIKQSPDVRFRCLANSLRPLFSVLGGKSQGNLKSYSLKSFVCIFIIKR